MELKEGTYSWLTTTTLSQVGPSIAPHSSCSSWFVSSRRSLSPGQRQLALTNSGLRERRADWFVKWTRTTAEQKTVHMASFEEGLGRVMYVAGALEHERPFSAPLYKYMTIHSRHSVQVVPSYVSFFLLFLAGQVEQRGTTLAQ